MLEGHRVKKKQQHDNNVYSANRKEKLTTTPPKHLCCCDDDTWNYTRTRCACVWAHTVQRSTVDGCICMIALSSICPHSKLTKRKCFLLRESKVIFFLLSFSSLCWISNYRFALNFVLQHLCNISIRCHFEISFFFRFACYIDVILFTFLLLMHHFALFWFVFCSVFACCCCFSSGLWRNLQFFFFLPSQNDTAHVLVCLFARLLTREYKHEKGSDTHYDPSKFSSFSNCSADRKLS